MRDKWWAPAIFGLLVASSVLTPPFTATQVEASSVAKGFVPITPLRLLDTRQPGSGGAISHGATRALRMVGDDLVPQSAVAVAMNVTVTGPTGDGFLTVWQSDLTRPNTSSLNFVTGETTPNLVTIGLGADGDISLYGYLYSQAGNVDVIVDVVGWYQAGFNPVPPGRVMDTRTGVGGFKLGPGETRDLVIQGAGNLPSSPIGAVALNVTAVGPTRDGGFLTVWPTGRPAPTTSSVNFQAGEIAANAVLSGVGEGGKISIFNFSGETDVLVDVTGWFSVGYDALTPHRVVDTRQSGQVSLGPGETRTVNVVGVGGVPTDGVGAVALNVTVTEGSDGGFLTIWPDGPQKPTASSLNYVAGQTVANAVVSGVGASGRIAIHNPFGSVHVIIDITGWYARSDAQPPEILELSVSPSSINTSTGSKTITVTAHITDDVSGVSTGASWSTVYFRSPSGNAQVSAWLTPAELISGTALDGTYQSTMTVPAFAESGTWTIAQLSLFDGAGNQRNLTTGQLATLGITTTFTNN